MRKSRFSVRASSWMLMLSVLTAAVLGLSLLGPFSHASRAASGPVLSVLSPPSGQVITGDNFTVILSVTSRFPVMDMAIKWDDWYSDYTYFGIDFKCDAAGTRCEVPIDLDEWDEDVRIEDGMVSFDLRASDSYYVKGPPVRFQFILNRDSCLGVLYSPSPGDILSGVVNLEALPTCGPDSVDFYVDGVMLSGSKVAGQRFIRQSWDTRSVSNGTHTIAVGGYDGVSHEPPGPAITVTVRNPLATQLNLWPAARPENVREAGSVRAVLTTQVGGAPLSGQPLSLVVTTEMGTTYTFNGATSVTGEANFDLPAGIGFPLRFTVTYSGAGDYSGTSQTSTVSTPWGVSYRTDVTRTKVGQRFTLTVKVLPAQAASFAIQRGSSTSSRATWIRGSTNASGTWTRTFTAEKPGNFVTFVLMQANDFRRSTRSDPLIIRVG